MICSEGINVERVACEQRCSSDGEEEARTTSAGGLPRSLGPQALLLVLFVQDLRLLIAFEKERPFFVGGKLLIGGK